MKDSPSHAPATIAPGLCRDQVAAPSLVCQISTASPPHAVVQGAKVPLEYQPWRASRNETSPIMLASPAAGGRRRCSHVLPRSVERESSNPARDAHTTLADGALNWAALSIGIALFFTFVGVGDESRAALLGPP